MKLKRVRLRVEPLTRTSGRWKKALRGKATSREAVISVASWKILGRILSPGRLEILASIPTLKPRSIADLARSLKRDFKNIHSDLTFLADLGLVELREEGKTLVPLARWSGIDVDLAGHDSAA
jgi:predicted transcriptional regulator